MYNSRRRRILLGLVCLLVSSPVKAQRSTSSSSTVAGASDIAKSSTNALFQATSSADPYTSDAVNDHGVDLYDDSNGSADDEQATDAEFEDMKLAYDLSEKESEFHFDDFFHYKTRPDLQAPRWNITVHRPFDVAPGYWFTAPYENIFQRSPQPSWNGPHIYDNDGELIWSGAHLCEGSDCFDFRLQRVHGRNLLVFLYRHEKAAVLLDHRYRVVSKHQVAKNLLQFNAHDLNIIDNGDRVLTLFKNGADATIEMSRAIGYEDGKCKVAFDGFRELKAEGGRWSPVFEWNSKDHIPLNESTNLKRHKIENVCRHHWDYVHLNSVDKCPDGDYLLSSRHTDTIYKISKDDGAIKYRIGGANSDFEGGFVFTRQHHIRCLEQNQTHLTMTLMDNARGSRKDEGSHPYSRGLVITLNTASNKYPKPMQIVAEFPHPDYGFANSRGSLDYLADGNVVLSWALGAEMSEHLPNGSVVMQATLKPDFLSTYRAYKYEFVGRPTELPAVYAEQVYRPDVTDSFGNPKPIIQIYMSWNGATEVAAWRVSKTDSSGRRPKVIVTGPRTGFETMLQYKKPVKDGYVIAEALDEKGRILDNGESKVIRINFPEHSAAASPTPIHTPTASAARYSSVHQIFVFMAGSVSTVLMWILFKFCLYQSRKSSATQAWWRGPSYQILPSSESWEKQEETSCSTEENSEGRSET